MLTVLKALNFVWLNVPNQLVKPVSLQTSLLKVRHARLYFLHLEAVLSDPLQPPCLCSNRNGADDEAVLEHDAEDQEHKVEQEHGEAQRAAHLPAAGGDGDDHKEQHEEQQHDGTEEAVGVDRHRHTSM